MPRRRSSLVCLVAAAVLLGPAAPAARAGLWSAAASLGDQGISSEGDAAIDRTGTAIVAWGMNGPVQVAVRPPGRAFTPTQTLPADTAAVPAVALDGRGGGLVAWSDAGALGLAELTGGGSMLRPVASGMTGVNGTPDVAFVSPGHAVVVWAGSDGGIHALRHDLGGTSVALGDLAAGPGNREPLVAAGGGHAVAAWTLSRTSGNDTTTTVQASTLSSAGTFAPPEDIATTTAQNQSMTGAFYSLTQLAASGGGAADALVSAFEFLGPPGEVAIGGLAVSRPADTWNTPQDVGGADAPQLGAQYAADIAASANGAALYADGSKPSSLPTMRFSARLRPAGAARYGAASPLFAGAPGEIRAAPLSAGRFLVLIRSGSTLRSRAGSPGSGFGAPLVFSAPDAFRLFGLAGAPNGLGVAAWTRSDGTVQAAIYDDSLSPPSPPPPAARDITPPVLSRLAVSPRRFRARHRARIRWRLSERARVTLRIQRAHRGFRRGARCVARRPRSGRVRRCTRWTPAGTLRRTAPAGATTLRFDGLVRRRALPAGRYRLTAIPRDAAGNRSRPQRTRFTVLPAAR